MSKPNADDHLDIDAHIEKRFEITKLCGKGAYGIVWRAIDRKTKQVVALKKVFDGFANQTDAQRTYREVMFLQRIQHDNVVRLLSVHKAENHTDLYLVFEFVDTDLYQTIRNAQLQEIHKRFITYQLLRCVRYMHRRGLIHRDLKPANILLNSDCHAKIADFGLCRSFVQTDPLVGMGQNPKQVLTDYVATRWYRPPEIVTGSVHYGKGVDMWAVGCIIGEMLTGKPLLPGTSTLNQLERIVAMCGAPSLDDVRALRSGYAEEMMRNMKSVAPRPLRQVMAGHDKQAVDLMTKLLVFHPEKRISCAEAMAHPYVSQFCTPDELVPNDGPVTDPILLPVPDANRLDIEDYREALYTEMTKQKRQQRDKKIAVVSKARAGENGGASKKSGGGAAADDEQPPSAASSGNNNNNNGGGSGSGGSKAAAAGGGSVARAGGKTSTPLARANSQPRNDTSAAANNNTSSASALNNNTTTNSSNLFSTNSSALLENSGMRASAVTTTKSLRQQQLLAQQQQRRANANGNAGAPAAATTTTTGNGGGGGGGGAAVSTTNGQSILAQLRQSAATPMPQSTSSGNAAQLLGGAVVYRGQNTSAQLGGISTNSMSAAQMQQHSSTFSGLGGSSGSFNATNSRGRLSEALRAGTNSGMGMGVTSGSNAAVNNSLGGLVGASKRPMPSEFTYGANATNNNSYSGLAGRSTPQPQSNSSALLFGSGAAGATGAGAGGLMPRRTDFIGATGGVGASALVAPFPASKANTLHATSSAPLGASGGGIQMSVKPSSIFAQNTPSAISWNQNQNVHPSSTGSSALPGALAPMPGQTATINTSSKPLLGAAARTATPTKVAGKLRSMVAEANKQ